MLKTILNMLVGAVISAAVTAAFAVTGTPPGTGLGLVDGAWLTALTQGSNYSFQSGIAAAGTTQATATVLSTTPMMYEVDTVAASTGVALPQCLAGDFLMIRNGTTTTLAVYGNATANSAVSPSANDTINGTAGSSAYSLTSQQTALFFCAKTGSWSALHGS
jgi:hypothetical protein